MQIPFADSKFHGKIFSRSLPLFPSHFSLFPAQHQVIFLDFIFWPFFSSRPIYTMSSSSLSDVTKDQLEHIEWKELESRFKTDFIQNGGVTENALVSINSLLCIH